MVTLFLTTNRERMKAVTMILIFVSMTIISLCGWSGKRRDAWTMMANTRLLVVAVAVGHNGLSFVARWRGIQNCRTRILLPLQNELGETAASHDGGEDDVSEFTLRSIVTMMGLTEPSPDVSAEVVCCGPGMLSQSTVGRLSYRVGWLETLLSFLFL